MSPLTLSLLFVLADARRAPRSVVTPNFSPQPVALRFPQELLIPPSVSAASACSPLILSPPKHKIHPRVCPVRTPPRAHSSFLPSLSSFPLNQYWWRQGPLVYRGKRRWTCLFPPFLFPLSRPTCVPKVDSSLRVLLAFSTMTVPFLSDRRAPPTLDRARPRPYIVREEG